jgi:hypothetical protein
MIELREEHSQKHPYPSEITDFGILILFNLEQLGKQQSPITVIEFGIEIEVID